MNLLTARPGLTGLWQVSGRSDVSYEERGRLEMFYIRNYSIWLDVQLIVQTIPVVLSGRGAYLRGGLPRPPLRQLQAGTMARGANWANTEVLR
jgi:Bacterial sugar transferase